MKGIGAHGPRARARRRRRRVDAGAAARRITDGAAQRDQRGAPARSRRRHAALRSSARAKVVNAVLGALRLHLGEKLGSIPEGRSGSFCWVTDPRSSSTTTTATLAAAHHPFTSPHDEDVEHARDRPGQGARARYDLVLNGFEIGGGSIRLHHRERAGRGLPRARHLRRGAQREVRLPARRAQVRRAAARRHRVRHSTAWRCC